MRDMKMRETRKYGTPRVACVCLSIAEQECMSRQERAPEAPAAALRAVYGNDLTVSGCWFH